LSNLVSTAAENYRLQLKTSGFLLIAARGPLPARMGDSVFASG
jgi:hypothetical protein